MFYNVPMLLYFPVLDIILVLNAIMQRSHPPSDNQNRSTCAQACVTCTVNLNVTKKDLTKTWLTWKSTNQRSSKLSNKPQCWNFVQSESAMGAETYDSVPSVFTSVNTSSTAAWGRVEWAPGQKTGFKVCLFFKKTRKQNSPIPWSRGFNVLFTLSGLTSRIIFSSSVYHIPALTRAPY